MGLPATHDVVHTLSALFEPRSVALIGASADPQSISARPLRLLRQHGFAGAIYRSHSTTNKAGPRLEWAQSPHSPY